MDATFINLMRDPAGVPFFPVVFQGLYILTWALHAAFVLLAIGALGLSLYGSTKQKTDNNWKLFNPHLIMTGKFSVSMLILLGIAPLLFTQVIYDSGWYVANTLSGALVFMFIYSLIAGYMMFYWYSYANKKGTSGNTLIGFISFAILVFCGILMHNFSVESISPTKWTEWYAPNGVIDNSGLNFHIDIIRLAFMVSLVIPVTGIFMQNYSSFLSTRKDFSSEYLTFVKNLGTKMAVAGLLLSAVLFVVWMLKEGLLLHPVVLATIVSVVILLLAAKSNKNSYVTTAILVVVALFISGVRELIRYNIMSGLGYDLYGYPMNLEWETIIMFLLTFVILGFTGVAFILTMTWKVGKSEGVFDASKDVVVTKLANATLVLFIIWMMVYFAWGMVALFKNTL
ncbi:MAG: hypothetical protein IE909_14375 [Campylobacterales bacterium]|nr:hypothetical protein [Campylobacterales bacterium]